MTAPYDIGDQPVTGMAVYAATGDLYAATDFGVLRLPPLVQRTGSGPGPNCRRLPVPRHPLDQNTGVLYAATHGRGAYARIHTKLTIALISCSAHQRSAWPHRPGMGGAGRVGLPVRSGGVVPKRRFAPRRLGTRAGSMGAASPLARRRFDGDPSIATEARFGEWTLRGRCGPAALPTSGRPGGDGPQPRPAISPAMDTPSRRNRTTARTDEFIAAFGKEGALRPISRGGKTSSPA